ncbi:MAG: hypothetical protein JXB85_01925 [Anaerolineales bacterium]|nr:hypothetical protein [Anaerolineales bacterium]
MSLDEGNDFNLNDAGGLPPEESNNRTFLIVAGIMAGLVFLILICLAVVYFTGLLPGQGISDAEASATAIVATNQAVALGQTATSEAQLWTPTLEATTTLEATSTATPVVAMPTSTPTPDVLPLTATMAALRTQVAIAQLTPTGTLLPDTGFGDTINLQFLVIAAVVLVAVILLARRLRAVPAK